VGAGRQGQGGKEGRGHHLLKPLGLHSCLASWLACIAFHSQSTACCVVAAGTSWLRGLRAERLARSRAWLRQGARPPHQAMACLGLESLVGCCCVRLGMSTIGPPTAGSGLSPAPCCRANNHASPQAVPVCRV
jgi:hypothetical protein